MKKVMFIVIVVLLLIAFGVSAFMVANYLIDGKAQAERSTVPSLLLIPAMPASCTLWLLRLFPLCPWFESP